MNCDDKNIHERILLKRAIESGDMGLLSKIYEEHKPFLNKYLQDLVHLDGYAEDLTHDIFLAIGNKQCNYTGNTDVQGYLCGIAKKLALSSNKKEARQGIIFTDCLSEEIAQDRSDDPVEKFNLEEIRTAIYQAISKLPEKSRQAVELVLIHNLRPYQAARKSGCSQAVFRGRLSWGLRALRRKLVNFPKIFEL